jgi:hypothetical protein
MLRIYFSDVPSNPGEPDTPPQAIGDKTGRQHFFHQRCQIADSHQGLVKLPDMCSSKQDPVVLAVQAPSIRKFSRNGFSGTHFHRHLKGTFRPVGCRPRDELHLA